MLQKPRTAKGMKERIQRFENRGWRLVSVAERLQDELVGTGMVTKGVSRTDKGLMAVEAVEAEEVEIVGLD